MKSLKSMFDELLDPICWRSVLLGIFMIKWCVALSLIVLRILKSDSNIKISEILTFLPFKNNSVTVVLISLLDYISAII